MLIRCFRSAHAGLVVLGFAALSFPCCFEAIAQGQTAGVGAGQGTAPAGGPATPAAPNNQASTDHIALMHLIESIDPYHKQKEIKGSAVLSGSTTMMAIGKSWADRFRKFHPEVTLTRGVDGTEAAIKALAEDSNVIAGSSRPLSDAEVTMLKNGKCKEPLSVIVALDPLALYVHRDNPIAGVTPQQLESIFRAPGQGQHAATWGDLGLTGDWAKKAIQIQSRSDTSGTTTFIKQLILQGGEMAKPAKSHKTNGEVCEAVGSDTAGVGVFGFGEATDKVRAVPLLINGVRVPANEQSFLTGQYPFVRPLVLVVDKAQMKLDGGLREAVLRYILSRDGQMEAVREGFYPIDPAFIRQQLDQISGPQMR